MKGILSTIESEVLGPFSRLLAPGTLVVLAGAYLLSQFELTLPAVLQNEAVQVLALATVVLVIGMTIDAYGSHLESWWDERLDMSRVRKKRNMPYAKAVEREWYDYLRLAFDKEPVGHRYLRTKVLQLKFELNVGIAFAAAAVLTAVVVVMHWVRQHPLLASALLLALEVVGAIALVNEGHNTHKVLVRTRHEMLKKYGSNSGQS